MTGRERPGHAARFPAATLVKMCARFLVAALFGLAVLLPTTPAQAIGVSDAKTSCNKANNGDFDLTGPRSGSTVSHSIVGAAGYVYTFVLLGAITNSYAAVVYSGGSQEIFNGDTSGSGTFSFGALLAATMYLDIIAASGGQLRVRCSDGSSGGNNGGNGGGGNGGSSSVSLATVRNVSVLSSLALVNALFNPTLGRNYAINLLMGQSAEQARLIGLIRKYIFFERLFHDAVDDLRDLEAELAQNPGNEALQDEWFRLNSYIDLLELKTDIMYDALRAAGITPNMIRVIDAVYIPEHAHSGIDLGLNPAGQSDALSRYAPNPLSQTTGPLAAFNGFGDGGTANMTLFRGENFSLWGQAGIVSHLNNGNNGQSGLATGLKLGAATRINNWFGLSGELFGATGSFGTSGIGLTGTFSELGASVTPVLRINDNLFLSITGSAANFNISQNRRGVTANFDAQQYGLGAKLSGSFWYEFFLIEPDASVNWDILQAPAVTASNGKTIAALSTQSVRASIGGKVSASTIPIWGLPSVTPYLSSHVNYVGNGVGGAAYSGATLDLGGGVTFPLGQTGSLSLDARLTDLFLPAGSNVAGTVNVSGNF